MKSIKSDDSSTEKSPKNHRKITDKLDLHRSGLFSGFKNPGPLFRKDALQRKSDQTPQPNAKLEITSSGAARNVAGTLPATSVVTHMQASGSSNQFSSVENGMLLNNEHVSNLEASSDMGLAANLDGQGANRMQDARTPVDLRPTTEKALRAIARVMDASGERVLGLIQFDQVIMCFSLMSLSFFYTRPACYLF